MKDTGGQDWSMESWLSIAIYVINIYTNCEQNNLSLTVVSWNMNTFRIFSFLKKGISLQWLNSTLPENAGSNHGLDRQHWPRESGSSCLVERFVVEILMMSVTRYHNPLYLILCADRHRGKVGHHDIITSRSCHLYFMFYIIAMVT